LGFGVFWFWGGLGGWGATFHLWPVKTLPPVSLTPSLCYKVFTHTSCLSFRDLPRPVTPFLPFVFPSYVPPVNCFFFKFHRFWNGFRSTRTSGALCASPPPACFLFSPTLVTSPPPQIVEFFTVVPSCDPTFPEDQRTSSQDCLPFFFRSTRTQPGPLRFSFRLPTFDPSYPFKQALCDS